MCMLIYIFQWTFTAIIRRVSRISRIDVPSIAAVAAAVRICVCQIRMAVGAFAQLA